MNLAPCSRTSDPLSSKLADKEITLNGTREKQIKQAYEAVKQHRNCTSRELSELTGLDRYMLARRLPECNQAVKCSDENMRKCRYSNRSCVTWDLL